MQFLYYVQVQIRLEKEGFQEENGVYGERVLQFLVEKTAHVGELQMFTERILSVEKRCSCWKATNFSREKTFPPWKKAFEVTKGKKQLKLESYKCPRGENCK